MDHLKAQLTQDQLTGQIALNQIVLEFPEASRSYLVDDACYGCSDNEALDVLECCGEEISLSAQIPAEFTHALDEADLSILKGARCHLQDASTALDSPFVRLPDGQQVAILGGSLSIDDCQADDDRAICQGKILVQLADQFVSGQCHFEFLFGY